MELPPNKFKVQSPRFAERVAEIFKRAPFIQSLGIQLENCAPGYCETVLISETKHLQQDDVIHAGVVATMADHTAGGAAGTLIGEDEIVLTVEFKINLLRPARGKKLRAQAQVLKAGRTLSVVESEVWSEGEAGVKLVAKAIVTLAVVAPLSSSK